MPTQLSGEPRPDPPELRATVPELAAVAVSRPAPGLACIRVPLPYPIVPAVNVYVLELAAGPVLVDCGTSLGLGWAAIERGLDQLGIGPAEIEALVLTHTHSDHAGLAAELVGRCGCRLLRGAGPHSTLDLLRDRAEPLALRRERAAAEGVPTRLLPDYVGPLLADDGRHVRAAADRLLTDGEALPGSGGEWRAHATPGHSPNQICLHRERDGALISADLVLPVSPPYLEWGQSADPAAEHAASLAAARALAPTLLLPGHGRAIEDPGPALAAATAALQQLLEDSAAALRPGPASGFEAALRLAPAEAGLDQRQSLLATVLAALEHLERTGRAEAMTGADGVRRFALAG